MAACCTLAVLCLRVLHLGSFDYALEIGVEEASEFGRNLEVTWKSSYRHGKGGDHIESFYGMKCFKHSFCTRSLPGSPSIKWPLVLNIRGGLCQVLSPSSDRTSGTATTKYELFARNSIENLSL